MWPIIGLKRAVIVVGGSETGEEEREEGADESADSDDWVVVASGKVVNRMPVDTAERWSSQRNIFTRGGMSEHDDESVTDLLRSSPSR